ncbi:ATP-binding cassette domain-containing protein, partial [Candidatus Micrarchaeota archaeon]|nr:ATP-binding cassette domain-containing protein [Candidatus Micrarchaeota archaeon]
NGSGKSTTIKILTGVIVPTSGRAECLGFEPWTQRKEYSQHIGVVFGQKSLLWWDLKVEDSLKLYKEIFGLTGEEYKSRLEEFNERLQTAPLLQQRTRKLSLGERMRCELIAALMHQPELVFLDEPTIGLDVVAKEAVRSFLADTNRERDTTIVLTTHDIGDIEALCERVILVDAGRKVYDGTLDKLKEKYVREKEVRVFFSKVRNKRLLDETLAAGRVEERTHDFVSVHFDLHRNRIAERVEDFMRACDVVDLSVHDPELSSIIARIYKSGKG